MLKPILKPKINFDILDQNRLFNVCHLACNTVAYLLP